MHFYHQLRYLSCPYQLIANTYTLSTIVQNWRPVSPHSVIQKEAASNKQNTLNKEWDSIEQ